MHYKYGKKYSVATLFKQRLYKRSLVLRPWNENNVNFCQNTCSMSTANPNNIYLFKVNNRNTIKRCKICLKLTIKTPERRQWRRSGVIVDFEQVNLSWENTWSMFMDTMLDFLLLNMDNYVLVGKGAHWPFSRQCSISKLPENIWKPKVFRCFQGGTEM